MSVIVTVTPPPEQLPIDNWPIVAAEAEGATVAQARMAKLKNPYFNTLRFSIVLFSSVSTKLISKVNNYILGIKNRPPRTTCQRPNLSRGLITVPGPTIDRILSHFYLA